MLIRHNEDDLDKVFRQKLYGAEEETPLHLWEGIRQRVPQRKRILWRWLLPVLLLGLGTSLWASYTYIQSLPSTTQVVATASIASPERVLVQHSTVPLYMEQMSDIASDGEDSFIASMSATHDVGGKIENRQRNDIVANPSSNTRGAEVPRHRKPAQAFAGKNTISVQEVAANNQIGTWEKDGRLPAVAITPIDTPKTVTMGRYMISEYVMDSIEWTAYTMPVQEVVDIQKDTLTKTLEREVFAPSLPYIDAPAVRPSRFSLGAYYSLAQPMRVKRSGADDANFRDLTNRTDLSLAHGLGVQASYRVFGNWEVSAGLEYQRFNERHRWFDTTIVYGKIYSLVLDSVYDGAELTVTPVVHDSTVSKSIHIRDNAVVNRYTRFQMPLIVRWNYVKGKYSLGLEGGVVLHLQSTYKGGLTHMDWIPLPPFPVNSSAEVAVTAYQYQSRSTVPLQKVYKDWNTDLHFGIHQSYRLAHQWSASLVLQTRIMINDADAERYTNHRMIQPGLRVGINYFIR
jgi:hypothetical protein